MAKRPTKDVPQAEMQQASEVSTNPALSEAPHVDAVRVLLESIGRELKRNAATSPDAELDEMALRRRRRIEIYGNTPSLPRNARILTYTPPESLTNSFRRLYPEKNLPDFSVLTQHIYRIDEAYYETVEVDETALKKRLTPPQRAALAEGAQKVFSPETLESTHRYLMGLYVRMLIFSSNLAENFHDNLISTESFTLKHDPMQDIVELISYMQNAYPEVCHKLMTSSEIVKALMINRIRILKEDKERGTEPKSKDFQKNTREYSRTAKINADDVIRAARMCNSSYVADSMATGLETGMFAVSYIAADNLAPAFVQREDSTYAFEDYFPFKLDYLLAASSCIIGLMPQIRLQIANVARVRAITKDMRTEN